MVILITGATHCGKTALAQKLLEKYKLPYMSQDHIKMGLIRTEMTALTPDDDEELLPLLWKMTVEIAKTAIENRQNLIIEGCYMPKDYKAYFSAEYLNEIRFICLVFSEKYIKNHFDDIKKYASVIENRLDDSFCTMDLLLRDNKKVLDDCIRHGVEYFLIDEEYDINKLLLFDS